MVGLRTSFYQEDDYYNMYTMAKAYNLYLALFFGITCYTINLFVFLDQQHIYIQNQSVT